jgi:hypothetical protein
MSATDVSERPESENTDETLKATSERHARGTYASDARLRKFATWAAVLGAMAMVSYFAIFMMIQTLKPGNPETSWIINQFRQNFAATLAVPLSAVASFCIVTLLRVTTGPIEVEAQGIKFSGAAGPIIFWILCFIVIVFGVKILWGLSPCA